MSDDKRDVNAILGGIGDSLSKLGKDVVDLVKVGADKAQDAYSDYQSKAASASKDEASKDDAPKEDMAEADTVEEADTAEEVVEEADTAEEVVEEADTAEEVVEEADTTVEEDTSEDNRENKS